MSEMHRKIYTRNLLEIKTRHDNLRSMLSSINSNKPRLLTGDRPTGSLHLGHYVGSLQHRVKLQDSYESFILIADYHMLTTKQNKEDIEKTDIHARELMNAYLSVGLDPGKVTFYLQSQVSEVAELTLLLSMMVTVPRLQRLPSLKEMACSANLSEMPLGLLSYPVLQSADILLPRAHIVPVGKDNEAHIELTRELVRRFNSLYEDVFPEPEVLVGSTGTLVGIDGKAKMSKSLNNAINLFDDEKTVEKKVMRMYTDPNRIRADVPGCVENNPVFLYHDAFNANKAEVEDLKTRYREGTVGDVEVKQKLHQALNEFLNPIREKKCDLDNKSGYVDEILYEGTMRMRHIAQETIVMVRKAMGLSGVWNRVRRRIEKCRKNA